MGNEEKRVLVIGLDCATPQLVFERWREHLPTISGLMERGAYGLLQTIVPPITVPAWTSMMTSKNPGRLGFYGFRNRGDYSYEKLVFANSKYVKEDTVWDILSRHGRPVVVLGVPQTYPPKPVNGCLVTCFLTPSTESEYTYPPDLKQEINEAVGGYVLDVENFRTDDKESLLEEIYAMTANRFELARYLMEHKPWDFFMVVEMGIDRIHHGFWKYFDTEHPKYEPGSPYESAIFDYYRYVDDEVGRTLDLLDDRTAVLIVSDHGAKRMDGGICFNEWLIREGYLRLKQQPDRVKRLEPGDVDWAHTKAWGEGGYYGRLFLNVKGREPSGTIPPEDYEKVRDELKRRLEAIEDPEGRKIGTRVFKPQEIYPEVKGIAPDLIVYFGNLDWRSVGSIGLGTVHTFENDTGPDDANHAEYGIFIMYDPGGGPKGKLEGLKLIDCAPTVLRLLGVDIPGDMEGKAIR
jgi:predicted AlkP superfamily phosphohydrolase/phosphomutase